MITKRTVLILGAGSNVHLGYPLGIGLVNTICSRITGKQVAKEIADKFTQEQLEAFRVRLSRSGHGSIDAFLEHNPSDADLGRLLIADRLKQCEDEDRLFPPNDPGWYRDLFGALAAPKVEAISRDMLTIITFNYDRSIEAFLFQSIKHRYKLTDEDACRVLKTIPIIHPHGILGEYPDVPYTPQLGAVPLAAIAEKLSIIYELKDKDGDFCNDAFGRGNAALQQAERIIFLGFGFHEDNLRRFNFFSPDAIAGKSVLGTLQAPFSSRKSAHQRLDALGIDETVFPDTSCERFFSKRFGFD